MPEGAPFRTETVSLPIRTAVMPDGTEVRVGDGGREILLMPTAPVDVSRRDEELRQLEMAPVADAFAAHWTVAAHTKFVEEYGLLGLPTLGEVLPDTPRRYRLAELTSMWSAEQDDVGKVQELHRLMTGQFPLVNPTSFGALPADSWLPHDSAAGLRHLDSRLLKDVYGLEGQRLKAQARQRLRTLAGQAIERLVSRKLHAYAGATALSFDTASATFRRVSRNQTLIGLIWTQVAQSLTGEGGYRRCENCQGLISLTDRRQDARFCSDVCRAAHHQSEITKARRMFREGAALPDIASELSRPLRQVQQWKRNGWRTSKRRAKSTSRAR